MSKSEIEVKLVYFILFYLYSILFLCVHQNMCGEEGMRRETREKRRVREPRTRIRVKVSAGSRQELVMKARGMGQSP